MNQDKARDFFSAYYEGNLEPGLRQSLEARFRVDATLQADYSAFVETMEELGALSREEIEVPIFLSDRITTRLEQEQVRRKGATPVWSTWLRGLAFGCLGAAAIAGAFLSLRSSGRTATAGVVGSLNDGDQPLFALSGTSVILNFHPSAARSIVVSSGVSGREITRFAVDATSPAHPFENTLPGTAIFQIQIQGDAEASFLALPGVGSNQAATSSGTMKDFAVAVATRYRIPVVLHVADAAKRLSWKLDGIDPDRAASAVLPVGSVVVDQRATGILNIGDH